MVMFMPAAKKKAAASKAPKGAMPPTKGSKKC